MLQNKQVNHLSGHLQRSIDLDVRIRDLKSHCNAKAVALLSEAASNHHFPFQSYGLSSKPSCLLQALEAPSSRQRVNSAGLVSFKDGWSSEAAGFCNRVRQKDTDREGARSQFEAAAEVAKDA